MELDKCFDVRNKEEVFATLESYLSKHPLAENAKISNRGVNRMLEALLRVRRVNYRITYNQYNHLVTLQEAKSKQYRNVSTVLHLTQALGQQNKIQKIITQQHISIQNLCIEILSSKDI